MNGERKVEVVELSRNFSALHPEPRATAASDSAAVSFFRQHR
jgi:hypothetical protein